MITNQDFTPEFLFIPWLNSATFLILGIVVAYRIRRLGSLASWTALGLVVLAGTSHTIETGLGFAFWRLQLSDGFYQQSTAWQTGWFVAKLALVGFLSFGLVRGIGGFAASCAGSDAGGYKQSKRG
ncbi:MAG: hypothetical protein IID40_12865 [Planctomycetes bacterium]|nr:hypothetical protein [Planctomycetota bacterium]